LLQLPLTARADRRCGVRAPLGNPMATASESMLG
jgi:hypothetical protein